ncbi:unnamed protein product [Urochloa decumbens]|uniref:Uncharacterized protein n=1 Tax=Urochloa decumbens TaxID=240449 RepID=A0ABC9BXM5_9POAL
MNLLAYAQNSQLTETVNIPGSEHSATSVRALPDTLQVLRRWYHCFMILHQNGLCLLGRFGSPNVLIYTNRVVRLTGVHLSHFTRAGGDLDYMQFVVSAEEFFTLRESVPDDIRAWLELIREGVNGYEYLIRYSACLMEPAQAFSWLMESRSVLDDLRINDPFTLNRVIWMYPELFDWDLDSYCVNTLMRSAREHVDIRTRRPIEFEPDVRGVLKLGRHCSQHPAKFKEKYMVLIIEDDFRGFVAHFQLILFEVGLLQRFNLELTMG